MRDLNIEPITLGEEELCNSCAHLTRNTDENTVCCTINAPRWDALMAPIYAGDRWGGCDHYDEGGEGNANQGSD